MEGEKRENLSLMEAAFFMLFFLFKEEKRQKYNLTLMEAASAALTVSFTALFSFWALNTSMSIASWWNTSETGKIQSVITDIKLKYNLYYTTKYRCSRWNTSEYRSISRRPTVDRFNKSERGPKTGQSKGTWSSSLSIFWPIMVAFTVDKTRNWVPRVGIFSHT